MDKFKSLQEKDEGFSKAIEELDHLIEVTNEKN